MSTSASTKSSNSGGGGNQKFKHGFNNIRNLITNIPNNNSQIPTISMADMNKMLDNEILENKGDLWIKLDRKTKLLKLNDFAEEYAIKNLLPSNIAANLKMFLISSIDKKKLTKTKEIDYDKVSKKIVSIPSLSFNQISNEFILRNAEMKKSPKKKGVIILQHDNLDK